MYQIKKYIYITSIIASCLIYWTVHSQTKILNLNNKPAKAQTTSVSAVQSPNLTTKQYYPLSKITFVPIAYSLSIPFDNLDNNVPKIESLNFGDHYTDEWWYNRWEHIWFDVNKAAYTPVKSIWDGIVVASANYNWSKTLETIFSTGIVNTWRRDTWTAYATGIYTTWITSTWLVFTWIVTWTMYHGYKINHNRWWIVIVAHQKPTKSKYIYNLYQDNKNNLTFSSWWWQNKLYISWIYASSGFGNNTYNYDGMFYSVYWHINNMTPVWSIVKQWQTIWYISPWRTPSNGYRRESHLHLWIYNVSPRPKSILPWYYKNTWDWVFTWWIEPINFIQNYNQ